MGKILFIFGFGFFSTFAQADTTICVGLRSDLKGYNDSYGAIIAEVERSMGAFYDSVKRDLSQQHRVRNFVEDSGSEQIPSEFLTPGKQKRQEAEREIYESSQKIADHFSRLNGSRDKLVEKARGIKNIDGFVARETSGVASIDELLRLCRLDLGQNQENQSESFTAVNNTALRLKDEADQLLLEFVSKLNGYSERYEALLKSQASPSEILKALSALVEGQREDLHSLEDRWMTLREQVLSYGRSLTDITSSL